MPGGRKFYQLILDSIFGRTYVGARGSPQVDSKVELRQHLGTTICAFDTVFCPTFAEQVHVVYLCVACTRTVVWFRVYYVIVRLL